MFWLCVKRQWLETEHSATKINLLNAQWSCHKHGLPSLPKLNLIWSGAGRNMGRKEESYPNEKKKLKKEHIYTHWQKVRRGLPSNSAGCLCSWRNVFWISMKAKPLTAELSDVASWLPFPEAESSNLLSLEMSHWEPPSRCSCAAGPRAGVARTRVLWQDGDRWRTAVAHATAQLGASTGHFGAAWKLNRWPGAPNTSLWREGELCPSSHVVLCGEGRSSANIWQYWIIQIHPAQARPSRKGLGQLPSLLQPWALQGTLYTYILPLPK